MLREPYTAVLDTTEKQFTPIGYSKFGFKSPADGYFADVCGFRASAKTTEGLEATMLKLTDGLINMARLPRHVFVARQARKVTPSTP